jgi:isocitrate dehydrogenase
MLSSSLSRAVQPVTVIRGDGIGPEIVDVVCRVVEATGAPLKWEPVAAGEAVFLAGDPSGVPPETIDSIRRTGVVLKGPLGTPVGHGEKSANVTLRKLFETYANIRPVREHAGVPTPFSGRGIDLVVVRENVEDLYAGIEHMQTPNVAQCLKLISRVGCARIVRAAFELAVAQGRTTVHCATKSNIMKLTEGMLKRTFEAIAPEYPGVRAEHIIIDNLAHQLVRRPEQFDVIVTTNMNGDIISDLTSGLVGGLGFAGSANLGDRAAIFEAVHGSAPKYAGHDRANPTALLLSAIMMLRHLELFTEANRIENALDATLDAGITTADVAPTSGPDGVGRAVGTRAFGDAVIEHLDAAPRAGVREHAALHLVSVSRRDVDIRPGRRRKVGADVFIETTDTPDVLAERLQRLAAPTVYTLSMISNRGTAVWPPTGAEPDCIDHYRCRFLITHPLDWSNQSLPDLLLSISKLYRWMHVERLEEFDGVPSFTAAQGQR